MFLHNKSMVMVKEKYTKLVCYLLGMTREFRPLSI